MKITVLTEDTSRRENLACQHGLSLYIETETHTILFDTGQTDLFSQNAKALGLDLTKVDFCVISHGHYDHGGGVSDFLSIQKTAPIYINKHAFGDFYNADNRYIGLDSSLQHHPQVQLTEGKKEICPNITLHTLCCRPDHAYGLTQKQNDRFLPDDFCHEQYLEITEKGKKILISGCSHKGILPIMEAFRPDIFIGGLHLLKLPTTDPKLAQIAKTLKKYNCHYYTGHCTGKEQTDFLVHTLPHIHPFSTGDVIEI
jgi:7,8-dihydropterin-6-yl-methyl-4-(beta-D-ribofuranosyl)aminobenzene 5'-phosphate synthase